jgi:hypothetical protein
LDAQLKELDELDLSFNLLTRLPRSKFQLFKISWLSLVGNPTEGSTLPPQLVHEDGRRAAQYARTQSYHDMLLGRMGSNVLRRVKLKKLERLALRLEQSETSARVAELLHTQAKRLDKMSTLSRYSAGGKVAEGWPCEVANLETGEREVSQPLQPSQPLQRSICACVRACMCAVWGRNGGVDVGAWVD